MPNIPQSYFYLIFYAFMVLAAMLSAWLHLFTPDISSTVLLAAFMLVFGHASGLFMFTPPPPTGTPPTDTK